MELTGGLDGANKKLQSAVDQYAAAHHQLTIFEKESHSIRAALEQALNAKKVSESKVVELTARLTEVTNINVTMITRLTAVNVKTNIVAKHTSHHRPLHHSH